MLSINFSSSNTGNLVPLLPDLGIGNMLLVFFGTLWLLFIPVPVEIELSESFGFRGDFASFWMSRLVGGRDCRISIFAWLCNLRFRFRDCWAFFFNYVTSFITSQELNINGIIFKKNSIHVYCYSKSGILQIKNVIEIKEKVLMWDNL